MARNQTKTDRENQGPSMTMLSSSCMFSSSRLGWVHETHPLECQALERECKAISDVHGSLDRGPGPEGAAGGSDAICGRTAGAGAAEIDRSDGGATGRGRATPATIRYR